MASDTLKISFEPCQPNFEGLVKPRRLKSGVAGLDELIQGGFLENRVYTISGPPGSGKTTFCMQFLVEGACNGQPGLYIGFHESPENIYSDMSNYDFDMAELVKKGKIRFIDMSGANPLSWMTDDDESPSPGNVLRIIQELVNTYKIKRLVIDSIKSIKFTCSKPEMARRDMTHFVHGLKDLGCTTLIISELEDPERYELEQHLSHGLIFLHNFFQRDKMIRSLQIMKMRGTKHDCEMRLVRFGPVGLCVGSERVDRLA